MAEQLISQHGPGTLGYFRNDVNKPSFQICKLATAHVHVAFAEQFPNTYICTKSFNVPVVQSDLYPRRVCLIHVACPKRLWYTPYINSQACFLFIFSIKKLKKMNQGIKKCNLPVTQIFHSDLNKSSHYYKWAKIKNNYCIREHCSESEATNRIALGLDSSL